MEALLAEGAILVATTHAAPLKQWAMRADVPVQLAAMQARARARASFSLPLPLPLPYPTPAPAPAPTPTP